MSFYLSVAIGGALGSMARAWLGLAAARLTGPQFPWGTLLINILGSFVIGFFGTLTTSDGRFAVSADTRAFVMIGLCGGFTTFSSFSLQTFELARDGRMLQALGNIGLSVLLCLLAVAAGHAGAVRLERPHIAAAVSGGDGMGEVVVAALDEPDHAHALLEAGSRLLEIGGGGRLKALAVRMPPAAAILPSEEVLTADREAAIRAQQQDWAGQLRGLVARAAPSALARGVHMDWLDMEGDAAEIVADQGRAADAIVVARPSGHASARVRDCMHAALFETGTAVLVVPGRHPARFGRTVAIAWKADERAVKAVRAAIPLLRQAASVHVLCAGRPAEMPPVLAEHGIAAELHAVAPAGRPVGEALLRAAHDLGTDLLVMGAFAHGEWREALFGGVTRDMLARADLPLFMRH